VAACAAEVREGVPERSGPLERRYVAALPSYDVRRDPVDHVLERVLPVDLGMVHAVALRRFVKVRKQPQFLDSWQAEDALCGRRVKVLLPLPFRPQDADGDQCERCRALMRAGATHPRLRRELEDEAADATGLPPTSGHPWTGRTWRFGAADDEPEWEPPEP
jgi:hypothetical protein